MNITAANSSWTCAKCDEPAARVRYVWDGKKATTWVLCDRHDAKADVECLQPTELYVRWLDTWEGGTPVAPSPAMLTTTRTTFTTPAPNTVHFGDIPIGEFVMTGDGHFLGIKISPATIRWFDRDSDTDGPSFAYAVRPDIQYLRPTRVDLAVRR